MGGRCWGSFGSAGVCPQEVVGQRAVNWAVRIAGPGAVGLTGNWVGSLVAGFVASWWVGMAVVGFVDCWW